MRETVLVLLLVQVVWMPVTAQVWNTHETTPVGASAGSFQQIRQTSGNASGNNYYSNLWLLRRSAGTGWTTTDLVDGISVDASFTNPGTTARTWWKRDPANNVQSWGDGTNTNMTLFQGKLGIGNSNPVNRLSISGPEQNSPSLVLQNTSYGSGQNDGRVSMQFAFADHVGPKIEAFKTGNNVTGLRLYTEYGYNINSLAMTFRPIGANVHLVGIGTDDPTTTLDVNGSLMLRNKDNAGNAGASIHFTSYGHDHPGALIRNSLHYADGSSSRSALILSSYWAGWKNELTLMDGRVGINTGSPDEALTVKGKIHTSEVRVDLQPNVAPDYVFENDYNLLSLEQVEAYIKANKHLPEVPSAKQMEAEGMNLKEMNLILLKKVEELTLHVVDLNKQLIQSNTEKEELESNFKTEVDKLKREFAILKLALEKHER